MRLLPCIWAVLAGVAVLVATLPAAQAAGQAAASARPRKLAEQEKRAGDTAGDAARALAAYERAILADPTYLPSYEAAAPLWFAARQYDLAIVRLDGAVKLDARFAMGWYHLAFAHRKKGHYAEAILGYQKFIALRPGEPDAYYGLGLTYKAMGQHEQARVHLSRYIALERRAERQSFVDKARKELSYLDAPSAPMGPAPASARRAGVMTPMPPASPGQRAQARTWLAQGDAAFAARRYDQAAAAYRGAIAADPAGVEARYRLGVTLVAQRQLPAAIAAWEGVLLVDPAHERARRDIERARQKQGVDPAAPADDAASLARARVLVDDGRWTSAVALLDPLASARDPATLSLRAEARLGAGDAAGAIVDWLMVLALDPRFVRGYRGLADAYGVLGDPARADYFRELGAGISR